MDLDGDVFGALGGGERKRNPPSLQVLGAHGAQNEWWTRLVNVDRRLTFTMYCMQIFFFLESDCMQIIMIVTKPSRDSSRAPSLNKHNE